MISCRNLSYFLGILLTICSLASHATDDNDTEFLDLEQAFRPVIQLDNGQLTVDWHIETGYYLYREAFKVERVSANGERSALAFTINEGEQKYDDFFARNMEIYHSLASLKVKQKIDNRNGLTLELSSQGCADQGLCFPPGVYPFYIDQQGIVSVVGTATDPHQDGLKPSNNTYDQTTITMVITALFAALIGGLILNLMPCVFPVLSLKALSLASGHESKQLMRKHGWSYTMGAVSSFLLAGAVIVTARSLGQSLGWGFQLQHPIFISVAAYLFFVIGLSLSGVFEFGGAFMGIGQGLTSNHSLKSSFFTGVLAALVASPCTAPFMAGALGVALTQPSVISLLIFAALGFGMALPFLMLSYSPTLSRWLPAPGPWMIRFKQFLAFPMYLTAIWLLWVLSNQRGSNQLILVLVGMLLIVMTLWLLELSPKHILSRLLRHTFILACIIPIAGIATTMTARPQSSTTNAETFSIDRLNDYRSKGVAVFVDMTADWCLTCKVNEKIALTPNIRKHMQEQGIVFMVGDWTNKNQEITAFLNSHKRSGIPLYLLYPEGGGEPELLPQVLTEQIVENAVKRSVPSSKI